MCTESVLINLEKVNINHDGINFLSDISLSLQAGDSVYLIGKTGSGKSTFLKSLYADISIEGNVAQILGYNLLTIKNKDIPYLRRQLGIVFQDFQLLLDRDVDKNLEFAMRATGWKDQKLIEKRKKEVLELVQLTNKNSSMPATLSDGEKQRVAIARALINDPKLILADEPTGNLDPQTSNEIMKVFKNINQNGTAILMATHDYDLFKHFPAKILKCENKKIFFADYLA
ncbi:MAG: ATP-binding cassette domain-containing protein [Bacteroidales bacterium]|jgi:cell division transport system ATP-binding protein|nr:ATP-binding cassette domain-containing protein [Bacteroidales bacterium]MDD3913709.1 ATP-binding cassette domain-containing protein [Bacteroidales bacterium]MDD4634639.1 ATP-binding cassette domain-containing protein [Bacteroidales bacterium]